VRTHFGEDALRPSDTPRPSKRSYVSLGPSFGGSRHTPARFLFCGFLGCLARVVPIVQPAHSKARCHVGIPQHNPTLRRGAYPRSWLTFKCECEIAWNSTFLRCAPSRCPEVHWQVPRIAHDNICPNSCSQNRHGKTPFCVTCSHTWCVFATTTASSTVRSHLHDVTRHSYSLSNVVHPTVDARSYIAL